MIADWGLNHPHGLWVLLALPLFAWARWRLLRRDCVPYPPLQLHTPRWRRRTSDGVLVALECLLVALLVVGVAGPHRRVTVDLLEEEGIDIVLVLDVSLSMLAEDMEPNRLEALQAVARDFVDRSGGHRLGVLVFAKDVYVQSPLTTDRAALLSLLDSVTVYTMSTAKSGGTAVGDALLAAIEHLRAHRVEGRDQAVILMTDGESNEGIDPILAARFARDEDVRVHAIGMGGMAPVVVSFEGQPMGNPDDPYRAVLNDGELRAVAAAAEGRYQRAVDGAALETIFAALSRLESAPLEPRSVAVRSALGGWLASAALPLLALVMTLGGVILRRPLR